MTLEPSSFVTLPRFHPFPSYCRLRCRARYGCFIGSLGADDGEVCAAGRTCGRAFCVPRSGDAAERHSSLASPWRWARAPLFCGSPARAKKDCAARRNGRIPASGSLPSKTASPTEFLPRRLKIHPRCGFPAKSLTAIPSRNSPRRSAPRSSPLCSHRFRDATAAAGVVEVLNRREGAFTADDAQFLEVAARLASQADALLAGIETERHSQLETVERLTALYDIARIFNSTLELEQLMPIVASKVRDILRAQACNLWLVEPDGGSMKLAQQDGQDPTVEVGAEVPDRFRTSRQCGADRKPASDRESSRRRIVLPSARKTGGEEFEIQSVICAPLTKETQVIGVIELVNKTDGTPFQRGGSVFSLEHGRAGSGRAA